MKRFYTINENNEEQFDIDWFSQALKEKSILLDNNKKNLFISFSGGETSAFMTKFLIDNKSNEYNILVAFANTGEENEETLIFVNECENNFNFKAIWIEAKVDPKLGKGINYNIVDFKSASRNGDPFKAVIKKLGIPNTPNPHCTRDLKMTPLTKLANDYFGAKNYETAIGIRVDEIDRISKDRHNRKIIYPLISEKPTTKIDVNIFWKNQDFRLNLKGYQGNCKTCWKKSDKKLFQIAKENIDFFNFNKEMEKEYPRIGYEFKKYKNALDRVFFRRNRSTIDLLKEAQNFNSIVKDDSKNYTKQFDMFEDNESCEVWTDCGIDN